MDSRKKAHLRRPFYYEPITLTLLLVCTELAEPNVPPVV